MCTALWTQQLGVSPSDAGRGNSSRTRRQLPKRQLWRPLMPGALQAMLAGVSVSTLPHIVVACRHLPGSHHLGQPGEP